MERKKLLGHHGGKTPLPGGAPLPLELRTERNLKWFKRRLRIWIDMNVLEEESEDGE